MIFEFKGFIPVIDESAYIHPQSTIIGNVTIGKNVYIGPHATLRGDWGEIIIEDGCNVQESCTIHMFPGKMTILNANAHIGHGAIIHGATIGNNAMIGMNSVILDDVEIGENSIVSALSLVKKGTYQANSLIAGNPAKMIKQLSKKMIDWKTKGTKIYQNLPDDCKKNMKITEPLRTPPSSKPVMENFFDTWENFKEES